MCAVSMISGHYQGQFPQYQQFPPAMYPDYMELLRKARLYDQMMNQPDCPDPDKAQWQEKLEKFMKDKYDLNAK